MILYACYSFLFFLFVISITLLLDSKLQSQCGIFWTRLKEQPLWLKPWHASFFLFMMLPTRVFCLQPWILHVAAPGTFCVVFALSYPPVAICFFLWASLLLENIVLGVIYHNTSLGKKYVDTVCLGADMVLYFLGNTGSVSRTVSKRALQGGALASGCVLVEKVAIDVVTFAETSLEQSYHAGDKDYDFNANWNTKKQQTYLKAPFQNMVSYINKKLG